MRPLRWLSCWTRWSVRGAGFEVADGARRVDCVGDEQSAEHDGILQRQHAALREVGQHRVGGIAQQRDPAGWPRRATAAGGRAPICASAARWPGRPQAGVEAARAWRARAPASASASQSRALPVLGRRSPPRRSRRRPAPGSARHARRASATVRPPVSPARPAPAAGITVRVAVAPTNAGMRVGHRLAHARPQAVGADERATVHRLARRARGQHALLGLRDRGQRKAGAQLDARLCRGRRQQRRVQVAAMGHPVGRAMPCGDPVTERQRASMPPLRPSCTAMASGSPTIGRSASATPRRCRTRTPLGPSWMPAPPSRIRRAAPARRRCGRSAPRPAPAPAPPMPPPAIRIGRSAAMRVRRQAQAAAARRLTRQPAGSVRVGLQGAASWTKRVEQYGHRIWPSAPMSR